MSDVDGAAPAAAEQVSAPAAEPVSVPNPIESSGPQPDPKPEPEAKPEKSASIRDALDKADAKLKAEPKEPAKKIEAKPEAKAEPKTDVKPEPKQAKAEPVESKGPERAPDGKFVSKEPAKAEPKVEAKEASFRDAPQRFSNDAKGEWEKAPESVKAEVHRMQRELESGINEYKQKWEPLKDYDTQAKQYNTTIKDALDRYTGLERGLTSQNPQEKFQALQQVFDYAGINMREFAAQLAGVQPDQASVHYEHQMQSLRNENAELKAQLSGYQEKEQAQITNSVEQFAQDPAHPRFDELSPTIAKFLEMGLATDLEDAYAMADRLKPAANAQAPVLENPAPVAPQPREQKSIAGTPTPGSSPGQRKPSSSIREALQRATALAG